MYKKFLKLKVMIQRFLSNRTNLNIIQCLLYFIIGYIMGQYLNWIKLGIMFIVLLGIQFITRTKAVADGMLFGHLMEQNNMKANEFLMRMKKEMKKIDKDEMN